ncbi:hypothetical protein PanWU01x14_362150 [Parasponia andersonii]|uniref:Uncharacterized protein n=1 Tax=Parasponia andersonii TaxID=3476 RepID=A0A2P5A716_PARAD|nr:hypothetical protein PanWU01x14_362150 [Parasponia andersonii]
MKAFIKALIKKLGDRFLMVGVLQLLRMKNQKKFVSHAATQTASSSHVTTSEIEKDHNSDSDSDESELDDESSQKSYENMYSQWIRVRNQNRSLEGRISAHIEFKENGKSKYRNWRYC